MDNLYQLSCPFGFIIDITGLSNIYSNLSSKKQYGFLGYFFLFLSYNK